MSYYYNNFFHKYLRLDTKKSYEKAIRQLCKHCDVIYPNEITRTHLLNWRNNVVGEGIKPITWNSYLRHLKCLYKFGIENDLLLYKENPCNNLFLRVGKPKKKNSY